MNMTIEKARQQKVFEELKVEGDCFPDLTTEAGAFWLLKRLPEWDRFDEFCNGLWYTNDNFFHVEEVENSTYTIRMCLTWLGKAPALYNALCEFMGLEVEG